ncbi:hypothetical protein GCM10025777_21420 [Membranihabitans marinus]
MLVISSVQGQDNTPFTVNLQLNPGPNNPRNSEGDFITLKDGRILYIYSHFMGKSSSDFGSSHLASRYSDDNGETWSASDKIEVENEGAMNVMSVSLLRLQNGDIALFYARKNSINDCIPQMRISKDEGQSWSDPISCITDYPGYYVLNNDRVIQLKNGRLLLPVALHESKEKANNHLGHKFNNKGVIYCYYSDDNGQTWKKKNAIKISDDITAQEPGLVELNNGHVLMFIRTDAGVQYQSISKNKGKTWSDAQPTDIPSPLSPASIETIPNTNDLVLVWNNNGVKGGTYRNKRSPFNIAISQNQGLTWKNVKTIHDDADGWYCYTAIHFINDKEFLLSYCAGNRPAGTGLSVTNISKFNTSYLYE